MALSISLLPERYAVCRLHAEDDLPMWATVEPLSSVTRTDDELSVVCWERHVPAETTCERGWRALKLEGPFDLSAVGVLLSAAAPLAQAGISILTIGTYDTDYIFVRNEQLTQAIEALTGAGHTVLGGKVVSHASD